MNERARIVILEKDAYVSFANCGLPYYLGGEITDRERLLIAKPALFERRFRIEVRTRHEVMSIDRAARTISVQDLEAGRRYEEHYDKLILAPGASPLVPSIPGTAARGVFTLRTLDDADRIARGHAGRAAGRRRGRRLRGPGDRRAVPRRGLEVALVEMQSQVMPLLDREMAEPLHRQLEYHGLRLELGRGLAAIEERDGTVAGGSASPTARTCRPTSSCWAWACDPTSAWRRTPDWPSGPAAASPRMSGCAPPTRTSTPSATPPSMPSG